MQEKLNFNQDGQILDMEFLMNTPKYVIRKNTKSLGTLYFMECSKQEAKAMIEYGHYSHKFNSTFGQINVGVYKEGRLLGVASYGLMMNKSVGIFSDELDIGEVIELNRMWVSDELGKNTETLLISNSIKIIKKLHPDIKLIQSFSDGRLGCGIMYQAANFSYYGYHETLFLINNKTGETMHSRVLRDLKPDLPKTVLKLLKGKMGIMKVKTYRYLYPLSNEFDIKMEQLPYPKNEGSVEILKEYNEKLYYIYFCYLYFKYLRQSNNAELVDNYLKKHITEEDRAKYLKKISADKMCKFLISCKKRFKYEEVEDFIDEIGGSYDED